MITVCILGAGNVACHFYKAFKGCSDIHVTQWYNRSLPALAPYKNEVSVTNTIEELKEADLYLLAVSDDAISDVSAELPFKNRLVAHTSGSVSIHELNRKNQRAVFYPLQSFSKNLELDFSKVPICIEVLEKPNMPFLKKVGESLGCNTYKINTEQRQTLHLSAVFVNNFANQLYRIAHEISDAKSINFDILKPLIQETARKIEEISPYMAQTGPAKRNDKKTIKRHLKQLDNQEHKAIYELLTASIQRTHGVRPKLKKQDGQR